MSTITDLGIGGTPAAAPGAFADKKRADAELDAVLIDEFQLWQEGYAGATVTIYRAGTTTPANVYADVDLTQPVANPQTLNAKRDNTGRTYGRFDQPLYTDAAYELYIDTGEQTGITPRPLTSLRGEDAGPALVRATHGSRARTLAERASWQVHALDFGRLKAGSPSGNKETIVAAIGEAASNGGGLVELPAGTFDVTTFSVPQGVILVGRGAAATVLQSQEASDVVEITGEGGGLRALSLDGINLNPGSTGIAFRNISDVRLMDVEVRRFDTALEARGGFAPWFERVTFINCNFGPRFFGDSDAASGGLGNRFERLAWYGGEVAQMTQTALEFGVVDQAVRHNDIRKVHFRDNIGSEAVLIYGAGHTEFGDCSWTGNNTNLRVRDNPTAALDIAQVRGLNIYGGFIDGGKLKFDGLCQDVRLERMRQKDVTFELNIPQNPVMLRDTEEVGGDITGETTQLARYFDNQQGYTVGTTTGSGNIVIWSTKLNYGHIALIRARATARQTDGTKYAAFDVEQALRCSAASLNFDGQTADFTVGSTIRGRTSGATGVLVSQTDNGSSGTLDLYTVQGTFVDDEALEEIDGPGDGRVNGSLTPGSVSALGSKAERVAQKSNSQAWDVLFNGTSQDAQVLVSGDGEAVQWSVKVDVEGL